MWDPQEIPEREGDLVTLDKIGNDSDLDVDGLIALCDGVLTTTRDDDMFGRYDTDEKPRPFRKALARLRLWRRNTARR
jgi:hypothetical protein